MLDYIVIGGGISGLATAWALQQEGQQGLVLEARRKAGGCIDSVCTTEDWCQELGAHSSFNSYGGLLTMLKSLPAAPEPLPVKKLPFLLYQQGQVKKVSQALHWLPLLLAPFKLGQSKQGKSVADFYGRLAGEKNYQHVIRHALAAVSSQAVDNMPADFLFQKRPRDKQVARKFSFAQGMGQMVTQLAATLPVRTESRLSTIQHTGALWQLDCNGETLLTKTLVLATSAQQAAQLLAGLPIAKPLSTSLATIETTALETLAVQVADPLPHIAPCTGWIGVDAPFYSMICADPMQQESRQRGFSFHFKPGQLDLAAQKAYVCEVLNIRNEQVQNWTSKHNQLPKITRDHPEKVHAIETALTTVPQLGIVGNFFTGMAIEDCVQRAWQEANRLQPA